MNNHLDIGTIQAFMDRELEYAASAQVSSHIASCDACAMLLAQAEDESAVVFPALEREFGSLVPTQRLWNRINEAIQTERRESPFWLRAWHSLRLSLISPSLAAAAMLVLVVGISALVWLNRTAPQPSEPVVAVSTRPVEAPPVVAKPAEEPVDARPAVYVERASYRPGPRRTSSPKPDEASQPSSPGTSANAVEPMPGEESYVKTIANLAKVVDDKKDDVLRPSQRVAFERDMAVVDDAIAKMRKELKRNPNNGSARQVLYSSYQNKIDLLNSVSQREELIASLR